MKKKLILLLVIGFSISYLFGNEITREDAIAYFKQKSQTDKYIYFQSRNERVINFKGQKEVYDVIGLTSKNVTDEDLKYLISFPEVEVIQLTNSKITDKGLNYFSELKKLRILKLEKTNITDNGLRFLKKIESLQTLDLFYTKVTDKGIQELSSLKNLTMLMLHGTKVTQKGIDELKNKLPDCYITLESREELH